MNATLACLCLLLTASPAAEDPRVESLWRLHYPRYARQCVAFEDGYVCVPAFDARFPNTRGVTLAEAQRLLSVRYERDFAGGMTRQFTKRPDDEEVAAYAALLPGLEVGHYGRITAVRVDEVIDGEQFTAKGIQLIDDDALDARIAAERDRLRGEDRKLVAAYLEWKFAHRLAAAAQQRDRAFKQEVRLVGFPTVGLRERQTWAGADGKGLDVAVVRLETFGKKGDKQRLVLMPRDRLRDAGLSEAQFLELLAARGLDKAGFVALVQAMHAEHRDRTLAERRVFLRLLAIDPPVVASSPASGQRPGGGGEGKSED